MADDQGMPPRRDEAPSSPQAAAAPNLMARLLTLIFAGMPLIFGIGFIAPLITQLLERALPQAAHAQWPLAAGLAVGGVWGGIANIRGRWL